MITGIQAVRSQDVYTELERVLVPELTVLLQSRGAGHCMRVSDLDAGLMANICRKLRIASPESQIFVLADETITVEPELGISSTKLVECRNPDESGALRSPLLVFIPNELKTSSEDSFGVATFEQIDIADVYRKVFDSLLEEMPRSYRSQIEEIRYLLQERAQLRLSEYQWFRYALTCKLNNYDPCLIGAALYELELIPDLTLHEVQSDIARRIATNVRCVDSIISSDKSAIAAVYDLQLDGDSFNRRLANYLNAYGTIITAPWVRNIVLDSANWDLTFDKWTFQYQQKEVDAVCIDVTDVALPVIPETEVDPQLTPLIGQKVLTTGQGGLKKFSVSFTTEPKSQDVKGLAKYKAQVFTSQGDYVGLMKVAKASKKSSVSVAFNKLTGIDWEEGWHYVRVQAFDDEDNLLPLVDKDQQPIPWGVSKEEEVGSRPNESELFYVMPAADTDVEPIQTRRPKEDALSIAKVKLQFSAMVDDGVKVLPQVKDIKWVESSKKAETLLDIQFRQLGGVQIPVSNILKSLEQRIIAEPMTALSWRVEMQAGEVLGEPVISTVDWPKEGVEEVYAAFEAARVVYLSTVRQGELSLVSVAHDFSQTSDEAKAYALAYVEYLTAIYRLAEQGESTYGLEDLIPLLRLDSLNITLWDHESAVKQAVLLGPTHPLRVLWLTGWSQLGEYWLNQSKGLAKELVLGARNGLMNELSLASFPYVLPSENGQLLVALDNLHPFWTVYGSAQEAEPQLLMDTLLTGLGISRPEQRQQAHSGEYLSAKFERYLIQHPYVHTLVVNVFNAGNATAVADTLLALEKRNDLSQLRYDVRLFVADPYAAGVGSDLLALLDIEAAVKASEADRFSQSTGNHLHPKLSVSIRSIDDFLNDTDRYSAHLSMLFDVFPAEEVAVVDQAADERVAPIYGLYQDYCVEYREENGLVTWDRYTRHGVAKPVFGSDFTEPLSALPQLMANITASIATGKCSTHHVPVVRLTLNPSERALLNQLHEVSDWVFTVDRNLGIEYFDHGGKEGRPDYLIDHSPDMAANNGHNFVITSRSTTEIQALLNSTLERYHLAPDATKAARVLDALRALSGRLALKLVSNSASKAEALGLALAKMYLDYQGVFRNQVVVPLDAHLELYQELQKNADELGDSLSLKRTDLALFDLDAANRTLRCNLVEVKCYSDVGDMASYSALKDSIAQQISQSERVLQQHFDPHRTPKDRPDRLVRTQKLCVMLEHYLKRSMRFGLLDSVVFEEAKYLLRTLEDGYKLVVSRSALIFDFGQDGTGVETEVGIEYHRVGRQYILDLLDADAYALQALQDLEEREGTEASLSLLELSLPKLTEAAFIPKPRERTISWDDVVRAAELRLTQQNIVDLDLTDEQPKTDANESIDASSNVGTENQNVTEETQAESTRNVVEDSSNDRPSLVPHVGEMEGGNSRTVTYDIVLGVNGDSAQFGLIGEVAGRKVALDLNHTHTISLFGVQGSGKSYTLGTVVEMATTSIPAINFLSKELASVIFHYSATQDYKPEFTSMIFPNDDAEQLAKLKEVYGAEPKSLTDVVLLTTADKIDKRVAEYPGIQVHPLKFSSAELQASHWKFLMGAVGNQAAYIRQLGNIMRKNRNNLTLNGIRNGVDHSNLSDALKDLAHMRLDFAEQYIDDSVSVSSLIKPGRMIIVDLRDEFIEKDEALGLFVVLLQMFSEAKHNGEAFNKLIVFDECHKYIDSPDLVKGLVETVREMRHKGTSVMIASQDPPSVPVELIELSTQIILHKFNSPAWLKHIQKANAALGKLTPEKLTNLQAGEAYIWSSKASDSSFTKDAFKVTCRPRVTKHGGDTLTAV